MGLHIPSDGYAGDTHWNSPDPSWRWEFGVSSVGESYGDADDEELLVPVGDQWEAGHSSYGCACGRKVYCGIAGGSASRLDWQRDMSDA